MELLLVLRKKRVSFTQYTSIGRKDAAATGREFSGWPVFSSNTVRLVLSTGNEINRS
jgi:hypothetical protein